MRQAEHLKSSYQQKLAALDELKKYGELSAESVIRKFRITADDGKIYETAHYRLEMILAVGYRVRSHRGTQFRQWATARLTEYLTKGFTLDDERLKNPPAKGHVAYFDELLERIRDIRSSERRFYQKVLDIYVTSVDYTPDAEVSQRFFATVQNKMHFAAHGRTAAEVVFARADASALDGPQDHATGRYWPQRGPLHRQELPHRGRTARDEPRRERLPGVRRAPGAQSQAHDDGRVGYEAR